MKKNQQTITRACFGSSPVPVCAAALMLLSAPAHAASVVYEFTGGSLAPTVTGFPAGVTASDFLIGSFPNSALQSDALRLEGGDIGTASTGDSFANNTVLSFSLTIPSGVTLDLTSLTFDYTSSGIEDLFMFARTYSSIHGTANVVDDTIGLFGKASGDPESATGVMINLDDPTGNTLRGSNADAGDFAGLTDQTVTFTMPMIRNNNVDDAAYIQFDNVTLNFIPEPSAALLGGLGLLALLRRRR